jgi:hypothetical protein
MSFQFPTVEECDFDRQFLFDEYVAIERYHIEKLNNSSFALCKWWCNDDDGNDDVGSDNDNDANDDNGNDDNGNDDNGNDDNGDDDNGNVIMVMMIMVMM